PVIWVEGRTYPVEVRYRPLGDEPDDDVVDGPGDSGNYETGVEEQTDGIIAAVDELAAEEPGDILVFLSGEREIRDTADAVNGQLGRWAQNGGWEVRPAVDRLADSEEENGLRPQRRPPHVSDTEGASTARAEPGIK